MRKTRLSSTAPFSLRKSCNPNFRALTPLQNIQRRKECEVFSECASLPEFNVDDLVRHGADAHHVLADADGRPLGRCSLWWEKTPKLPGHRLGVIGHYAACNAGAAAELLKRACAQLSKRGCSRAVGPMDGNTWRRYRFVTDRGNAPAFFLEPENPAAWPRH